MKTLFLFIALIIHAGDDSQLFLSKNSTEKQIAKIATYQSNIVGKKIYFWDSPRHVQKDKIRGLHIPAGQIQHIARTKDKIIFNVTYHNDQNKRRRSYREEENKELQKHLIFHGGSFTYGHGLADHQTLPWIVGEKIPRYRTYNYAIPGSAPHMALADLRARPFKKEINEPKGFFFYLYISEHIARANGFMQELQWLSDSPLYKKTNGEMVLLGSFLEATPWRTGLLEFLYNKIKIQNFFNRNYPVTLDSHLHYTCDLFEALSKEYLLNFPEGQFVIITHPFRHMDSTLQNCLTKKNIKTISFPQKNYLPFEDKRIPIDRHPNEKLNQILAEDIKDWIKANSSL